MAARETLHTSGIETLTGTGIEILTSDILNTATFELDIIATATEAGDTLDVFVQTYIASTAKWIDVVHFTQVLGTDGAMRFIGKIVSTLDEAIFEVGTVLAVDTVRHILGNRWRCRWDIVDVTTLLNQSFTFELIGLFDE